MAKQINPNNLKPIFTILEINKKKELANVHAGNLVQKLEAIEAQNLKVLESKEFLKAFKAAEEAIKKTNDILGKVEESIGSVLFYSVGSVKIPSVSKTIKVITGPNKYDYKYLAISQQQYDEATEELENQRDKIDLKYETMKAQIMLAGDFSQVKDVLAAYNINLETAAEIADKA